MPVTLNDTKLRKLKSTLGTFNGMRVEFHVDPKARYADGTQVAWVALLLEFGTEHMIARPFMRWTLYVEQDAIRDLWAKQLALVVAGLSEPVEALKHIARRVANMMVDTIHKAREWATPLQPSTIARKGHSIPLYETGKLSESIGWVIRDRRGRFVARGTA